MSQSELKDMRKQFRNIVKEHLTEELVTQVKKELQAHIDERLGIIAKQMTTALDILDKRSKDVSISMLQAVKPILPVIST